MGVRDLSIRILIGILLHVAILASGAGIDASVIDVGVDETQYGTEASQHDKGNEANRCERVGGCWSAAPEAIIAQSVIQIHHVTR